jgi:hypothetical protein
MRDPMPGGMRATCSLCIRPIEVHTTGRLVRHGWKEEGRKAGEYGLGRQYGECPATAHLPLEQTDQDGLKFVQVLTEARAAWLTSADRHKAGLKSYERQVTGTPEEWEEAKTNSYYYTQTQHAYLKSGLEISNTRTTTKKDRYYGKEVTTETRTFVIPRGFKGVKEYEHHDHYTIPSYEALRAACEHEHRMQAKALGEAIDQLKAAIAHHAATEPVREVEVKVGTLHLACKPYRSWGKVFRTSCGSASHFAVTTEDRTKVNCTRCKKSMAAADKLAAEEAAVEALVARVETYLRKHGATKVSDLKKALGVADTKTVNRALEKLNRADKASSSYGSPAKWSLR